MKQLILLTLFVSGLGFAQQTPQKPVSSTPMVMAPATPAPAASADVKREIKDCTTYDGTKYKVVPMAGSTDCNPTTPVPKPTPKPKPKPKTKPTPKPLPCQPCPDCPPPTVVEKEKVTYNAWRVYGLVGYGQHGLDSDTKAEGEDVTNYYGPLFGAGVDYNVDENWSVGVQGLSNNSGLFSVGYSFGKK